MLYTISTVALLLFTVSNAASFTAQIDLSNVTNPEVSKYIFGMNMYQNYGLDDPYTGNYTLGRLGGNSQSRFNFSTNSANSGNDYYYINNPGDFTWQAFYEQANKNGLAFWTQIPAMGWVSGSTTKSWSFSQQKYGQQKSDECTNQPDGTTWCAKDAGNGVWVNGSNVVGNDPNDCSIRTSPADASAFVQAVRKLYPNASPIFSVDNEPTLWSGTHRDVHPVGSTYDEIVNMTITYGSAIKTACGNDCLVAGYSPWGWCGYFEDGFDHDAGFCTGGGPDYKAKGNIPLNAYYLQTVAAYEKANNMKILDIMDVHYYPAASGVSMSCDETSQTSITNRLNAPRSLYDYSYTDPSWINSVIALIPRYKGLINQLRPNTSFSISEYSFGGDTCITSAIAHSEALAVMATYGVFAATRWSKPAPGSMVTNGFNILTNYDGKGSNIYDSMPFAVNVKDSDVSKVSTYSFIAKDKSKMFVVSYNKDQNDQNSVNVQLTNNNDNLKINGDLKVYGVDKNGLSYVGTVTPNSASFTLSLPAWSIRLAVADL
eukprot:CAMPEP_0201578142 /NCGR_PEP_ID=MMETSP0190_2-20130828/24872_1 /ASSEMBLY_ACC=CAM_ASM_000263 /TAXON_ID=37353 /ORGANISM="Rosalina sp." /LENGTH=542 /DNA_ID=CAMNT_0048010997 /DNA_START=45 /DNA_END=1673 /DNA_ORIENTATION=-